MDCCENNETKSEKTTLRSEDEIHQLKSRLNRIQGQLNSIPKMLDENRYCGDIIDQLTAIEKAVRSISNYMLERHLKTCVVRDIKEDKLEVLDEIMNLVKKL